jgi:SAM-dependent methyltransferase
MARHFPIKRLPDGRALVNLGSSARVAPGWNNVDSSWLLRLARWPHVAAALHTAGIVSSPRYERLRRLERDVVCWDLRRGVPFPDSTFDVVYHSHVVEHIDREQAPVFLAECRRVLKPGGTIRIVFPDLEQLATAYLDVVRRLPGGATREEHAAAVDEIFDQIVRRVPKARAERPPLVRVIETILIGGTARSGEMHRWMYDRFSLGWLLGDAGFSDVACCAPDASRIAGWVDFQLDTEPDGSPYKPWSRYVEATRPAR